MPTPLRVHAVEWNVPAGTPFWMGGPGTGEQKAFSEALVIDSIGRSVADGGAWILARYAREFIWVRRSDVEPTVPGGDPAYDAAVYKVMELGAAALGSVTGLTEAQANARAAAAAKTAAGEVKAAAGTAAAKYGA